MTSSELTAKLTRIEKNQLHVLSRANELLGKEDPLILSDISTLQKLSIKAKKHIQIVTSQLKKLAQEKKKVIQKANIAKLDDTRLQKSLTALKKKEDKLQAKLKRIL